uniref:Uncharacterized protein n=1 Tax=Arundo donax TaxID=35708 RepID=A0A0A9EEQ2_ARUDO
MPPPPPPPKIVLQRPDHQFHTSQYRQHV